MQTDFQDRLARIEAKDGSSPNAQVLSASVASAPVKGRRAKINKALQLLSDAGIGQAYAYPPFFRVLGLKPPHCWGFIPMALLFLSAFILIFGGLVWVCETIGVIPRRVATIIELGPQFMVFLGAVMSIVAAGFHRYQARAASLPRWRDL